MRKKRSGSGARLGQHFLTAPWAAKKLVEAAGITLSDTVLEIGPGKGALTSFLLHTGAHVIAIEKDAELVKALSNTFREETTSKQLEILLNDIRNLPPDTLPLPKEYILAANIPYYITGEIIRAFLSARHQPRTMALLVQKEVADRIARSEKESLLSLSVKAYGEPHFVEKVSARCFNPPPSVDSAILSITAISHAFFEDIQEDTFFDLLHLGFSSKRKKLAGNLSARFDKKKIAAAFETGGLDSNIRAEDVHLSDWKELLKALSALPPSHHV